MENSYITYIDEIYNETVSGTIIGYDSVRHYYIDDSYSYDQYYAYNSYDSYYYIYHDNYLPVDSYNNYIDFHTYEFDDYELISGSVSNVPGVKLKNDNWFFVTEQLENDIKDSYNAIQYYINDYLANINESDILEYAEKYFAHVESEGEEYKDYNPLGIIYNTNPIWAPTKERLIQYIKDNFTNVEPNKCNNVI